MKSSNLTKLALTGILSGGLVLSSVSLFSSEKKEEKKEEGEDKESKYKEVHGCAGLNVCKGLGGCHVSEEKLAKLAKAAGVELEKAGKAHDCAGLNECKGLGGCKVTEEKFAKLKAKKEAKEKEEAETK